MRTKDHTVIPEEYTEHTNAKTRLFSSVKHVIEKKNTYTGAKSIVNNEQLEEMIMESETLMEHLKDHIIEEWQVAETIKETKTVSRNAFVNAMKQVIPRLQNPENHINEETFLRVYYDKTPFWCRRTNNERIF